LKINSNILFGATDMIFNFVPEGKGNVQFKDIEKWNKLNSYQRLDSVIDVIQKANLDFIELGASWINDLNLKNDSSLIETILINKKIKVYSICSLLPKELNIFQVDNKILQNYFTTLAKNLKKIKPEVLVFGSGLARNKPADISQNLGYKRFAEVIDLIIEIMNKNGLYDTNLLIETLNKNECNFINTSDEANKVIQYTETDKAGILFDIFHWYREEDSWKDSFTKYQHLIKHIHIADPITRKNPTPDGPGMSIINEMLDLLENNNYQKSISFECVFDDIEVQMKESLDFLKENIY
jgi:sugar phosphate isomerase/epimerase